MNNFCALFSAFTILYLSTGSVCLATSDTVSSAEPETSSPIRLPRSQAFFGVHFDLHAGGNDTILGKDVDPSNIGNFLERVKPDFVQYDCKGHPGFTGYPTKVGYASPGIVNDALKVWRQETARRGVGLYIHYSGVMDQAAVANHPEWARIDEKGTTSTEITSLFSDYVTDLMIPQLKEVTSAYNLDGVWVDGDCWGAKLDYSTTAVKQWRDKTGEATAPRKPGEPRWQEWKNFHRDAFERYLATWVDALHQFNPQLELCSNWAYTPHMPVPIKAKVDFLSGDYSAKESVDRARFEARYLDSTGMPWDLMAWGFNSYSPGNGGPHQMKHPEQLKQEAATVLALGGGMQVYYQPTRGGYIPDSITDTLAEVSRFCRDRQAVSHKSQSVPQIALLLSTASFLERSETVFTPAYGVLDGALHALLESGYSVDLMSEHQLAPRLSSYPVVAIAQAHTFDDAFKNQLLEYVRQGGSLVLLDRESLAPFKDDLGVEFTGNPENPQAYVQGGNLLAPVPGEWQNFRPVAADVLATRTTAGAPPSNPQGVPAVSSSAVRSGKIVAIYGPASEAYFQTHNAVLRKWVAEVINHAFPSPKARVINNPNIDMSLRRAADGRETVHLVNLSGAQRAQRFAIIDKIPGSGPVELQWVMDRQPRRFTLLPEGKEVPFELKETARGRMAVVSIPSVAIHAAVVPEF